MINNNFLMISKNEKVYKIKYYQMFISLELKLLKIRRIL